MINQSELKEIVTNFGNNISELSESRAVMLVFLRHFGCIFCRAALKEIAERKDLIEHHGLHVVFVHMSEASVAEPFFNEYGLLNAQHISDPECELYKRFGLTKGQFKQLFGLQNWVKGFELQVSGQVKYSPKLIGDGFQMPGIFLIKNNEIKESYIHELVSSKPDYDQLIKCCVD